MSATNAILVAGSLLFAVFFFYPRLLRSSLWRATVTPLASIVGSGFLVAGPVLAHAAGTFAWLAMLGLCGIAYLFGGAIRFNILHVEPEIAGGASGIEAGLERVSDLALSLAYFISVAYYLNLFASFGLRLGNVIDPYWTRVVATAVIAGIGILGGRGGLRSLERLEVGAVGVKLSLIGGLFAALAFASVVKFETGTFAWQAPPRDQGAHGLFILLGLVILVQGFETSRYLGEEYDAETRVRTMRWAQWMATGIYFLFVLLITSYFDDRLPEHGGETAIIDMLTPIGAAVAPLIICVALASQLSAAVADMNGAGGLLWESSGRRLRVNTGNLVTAMMAIGITWAADIFEIITYASKAFVAYYALQSGQAALAAWRRQRYGLSMLFAMGVAFAAVVIVFAVPAV